MAIDILSVQRASITWDHFIAHRFTERIKKKFTKCGLSYSPADSLELSAKKSHMMLPQGPLSIVWLDLFQGEDVQTRL